MHLNVSHVDKSFRAPNGSETRVLRDITFSAQIGEFVVLRGPNGCGKTTLMNLIDGVDIPSTGQISVRGQSPRNSRVGHLFQDYSGSLLPWMTLGDNATLPLRLRGVHRRERTSALADLVADLDFGEIPFDRYPIQSSGGQQQKACILRSILASDSFLILDEPFANLDRTSREKTIAKLQAIRAANRTLVLFVLHDLDDAILLADRIICLEGTPATINDIIAVDLPWPRHSSLLLETQFLDVRARVLRGPDHVDT